FRHTVPFSRPCHPTAPLFCPGAAARLPPALIIATPPRSSLVPPRPLNRPPPSRLARSARPSAAALVRSSPENQPVPDFLSYLQCGMVPPRRFSFSMRFLHPDSNRTGRENRRPTSNGSWDIFT